MTLDWLILTVSLAVALVSRGGAVVAVWFGASLVLWQWYESIGYWSALVDWAVYSSHKDFALMVLAGLLRLPITIILGLFASCIFHQVTLWQINTYTWENVTLIEPRSGFMMCLAAGMLATAILDMGGGTNGGRRVRNTFISLHRGVGWVLRIASQKVKA
jgi:hypothetical protein